MLPQNWGCHQSWHILCIPSPSHSSFLSSLRKNCMEKTQWRGQQSASWLYHKLWNTEESFGLMHTHTKDAHTKKTKENEPKILNFRKKLFLTAHTTYLWRHIATLRHPFPLEIQVSSYLRISCSTRHLRGKTQLMLQDTHLKQNKLATGLWCKHSSDLGWVTLRSNLLPGFTGLGVTRWFNFLIRKYISE